MMRQRGSARDARGDPARRNAQRGRPSRGETRVLKRPNLYAAPLAPSEATKKMRSHSREPRSTRRSSTCATCEEVSEPARRFATPRDAPRT